METRAPFVIVGGFVLAAIVAVFGFVFWLHNSGGLGPRVSYEVRFEGPVPGLLVGAAVLFNGIRVGEVTDLALAPRDPRRVNVKIAVSADTPERADTRVGLEFQGLTGVPVVALEGGTRLDGGPVTTLTAEAGAGQSMTQAARDALRKVDAVLTDNADPLKATIANFQTFSETLAKNSGKLDDIVAGLGRMMGGGQPVRKVTYDIPAAKGFPSVPAKALTGSLAIPEPTVIAMLDTQRLLISPPGDHPEFAEAMWADSIPKLLQARLIESFENYDIDHAPLRPMDGVQPDTQLALDIRRFQINADDKPVADIELSARIIDKDGKVVAARLFHEIQAFDHLDPKSAAAAFGAAFERLAQAMVKWVVQAP